MAPISIEGCRKPDLHPGRIDRTAAAQISAAQGANVPDPAPNIPAVTYPLRSRDQMHDQVKATKPKIPSFHKQ